MDHHRDVPVTGAHPGGGREVTDPDQVPVTGTQPGGGRDVTEPGRVPVTATQPGGGREENPPELVDPLLDPSHAANPVDGAPSPGPQPGSTTVDHDAERRHPKHRDA